MADFRALAATFAHQAGIDPAVFVRQINQESGFNPGARSGAGATGIAQFMPGTARGLGINPNDPVQALRGAAKLMASYVHKYGNYRDALIAYNAGPGAVGSGHLPAETQNYVRTILGGRNPTAPTGGSTTTTTRTTPGVDRTPQRAAALAQYLLNESSAPIPRISQGMSNPVQSVLHDSNSLLGTVRRIQQIKDTPARTTTSTSTSPSSGGGGAQGGVIGRRGLGRTDQGVDFTGKGSVPAVGDGVIVHVSPQNSGTGWPGAAGHGAGAMIVQRLANGKLVYYAENIDPTVHVGQRVRGGQPIARARGSYPFLESGWAADTRGTTLARATTGYTEGQVTPAGQSFKRFLGL